MAQRRDDDVAPASRPLDAIRGSLEALVRERQHLRAAGAEPDALEQNRQTIVRCQWELSHALIARYA